jgi:hypothetical protein
MSAEGSKGGLKNPKFQTYVVDNRRVDVATERPASFVTSEVNMVTMIIEGRLRAGQQKAIERRGGQNQI